jgi:hypothetical protein
MKSLKNIKFYFLVLMTVVVAGLGCKKTFLDEYNPSNRTTDNYYLDAKGYESLIISCYPLLRDITQQRALTLPGTDLFAAGGWSGIFFNPSLKSQNGNSLDQYDLNMNSSTGGLQSLWDPLYKEINRCNAAIERATAVKDMADAQKAIRVAEAKFLRSLCYFWAVQQWGDIPMPLTETVSGSLEVVKIAQKDVYAQIIKDLTESVSKLPATQTDAGRATQGAAKFLLAKVYLTRGWNYAGALGGTATDFTSALKLCDEIIASGLYPLETNWNNLWPKHNKNVTKETEKAASSVAVANASKEVIFAVQYANPAANSGDANFQPANGLIGNNMHSQFPGGPSNVAQESRTPTYNRFIPQQTPTWAVYRLFDPQMDSRYEGTFNSISYATVVGSVSLSTNKPYPQALTLTFARGDTTAIALPWNKPTTTAAERGVNIPGGTKKYDVVNTNEYQGRFNTATAPYVDAMGWGAPMFWKFWQPDITYGDGYSTFNDPLFRSAEAYLMAAEAIVKGASGAVLGTADVYYNKVLDRALGAANAGKSPLCATNPENVNDPIVNTTSYRATAGTINIDMILDEYGRELLGEEQRWYTLKRTATLITRAKKYNPWTAWGLAGVPQIADKHFLRPIPQGMLDNTSPKILQNPGY